MNTYAPTVLVVKDNEEMRAFLQRQLAEHYRVLVAADGEEGWMRVQEERPDLLISDAQMPGLDGEALCRRVKEGDLPSIPVILLGEESEEGPMSRDTPADEVLPKPFAMDELRRHVDRYLPSRELPDLIGIDGAGAFLKKVVRTIERRLHTPDFTTDELAETVSLSRRHLTRRLKAVTGKTPATLIRERRIERAKAQLEQNPRTIAEVGAAVGFRSPSHFSQVFREHVGCSPSTYVDRHAS